MLVVERGLEMGGMGVVVEDGNWMGGLEGLSIPRALSPNPDKRDIATVEVSWI